MKVWDYEIIIIKFYSLILIIKIIKNKFLPTNINNYINESSELRNNKI